MKTKEPAITVCMPVYNAARYLRECIDSILAQTFTDFELLIVDDGSTDNSRDIVRSYRDKRIRLMENRHDYIGSLNKLLDEAKGKYIARMDADDVMMPDRLAAQFEYMEEHGEVTVVGGRFQIIGKEKDEQNGAKRTEEVTIEMLVNCNTVAHPTVMMRKEDIKKHNLQYNRDFIYAEDYKLWLDTLHAGLRIVNITNILIAYRLSDGQVTAKYRDIQDINSRKIQQQAWEIVCRTPINTIAEQGQETLPPLPGNKLTIIMPFLNEREEVGRTLQSIYEHAGESVEIIIINDCSDDDFDYAAAVSSYRATYIVNKKRKGVAACRDMGVTLCKTPYFLLLDAHMRFYDQNWHTRIINILEKNDRQILCSQTRILYKDEKGITTEKETAKSNISFGAYLPFCKQDYLLNVTWNHEEFNKKDLQQPIPLILGAGYAASKRYWLYLKGLNGLYCYGNDEAYISLKVWLEGGRCVLLKDVTIGHIYRHTAPYKVYNEQVIYNQLFIADTLLSSTMKFWVYAVACSINKNIFFKAYKLLIANKDQNEILKEYYKSIFANKFEYLLPLHRFCMQKDIKKMHSRISLLSQIWNWIQQQSVQDFGVIEGKGRLLIWTLHFEDFSQKDLSFYWKDLMDEIDQAIEKHKLPWNFQYGLCGLGWMYIYFIQKDYITEKHEKILNIIDNELQLLAIQNIHDESINTGIGGILSYVATRIRYLASIHKNHTFSKDFIKALYDKATQIIKETDNVSICFFAIQLINIIKTKNAHDPEWQPYITDCMTFPTHIPSENIFWKISDITGYTLPSMIINSIITKDKEELKKIFNKKNYDKE